MTNSDACRLGGDRIVLALTFDSGYLAPASAVIRSTLLQHPGEVLQFEIVHDDSISKHDLFRLEGFCVEEGANVRFHLIDRGRLRGLPSIDRFGPVVWSRLFLPEILDGEDRVLYLDCDTLVLGSLATLWRENLRDAPLGAVANVVEPAARLHVANLGIPYPGGFFNSGALLLQLRRMRDIDATKELVDFALGHADMLLWPDQDALNVVFKDAWMPLHPRWNAQNSLWSWRDWAIEVFGVESVDAAVRDPSIRHFEGPSVAKPWHYLCPAPHREVYLDMLSKTPWAGDPLEARTTLTRLISLIPPKWRLDVYSRVARRFPAACGAPTAQAR